MKIEEFLNNFVTIFDSFINKTLVPFIKSIAIPEVSEVSCYTLKTGGKHLRPALVWLSAGFSLGDDYERACQNNHINNHINNHSAFYIAAAVELSHSYSLIHDDLPAMDNDKMRRGRPSCHIEYSEPLAILAGDALNSLSFELLAIALENNNFSLLLPKLIYSLSRGAGIRGMIAGQALDIAFSKENTQSYSLVKKKRIVDDIHQKKTASLFETSCELGSMLAGSDDQKSYKEYGRNLGLLFQITDDILDIEGDAKKMGKAVCKDVDKLSYPNVFGMEESKSRCRNLVDDLENLAYKLQLGVHAKIDYRPQLAELPSYIYRRTK